MFKVYFILLSIYSQTFTKPLSHGRSSSSVIALTHSLSLSPSPSLSSPLSLSPSFCLPQCITNTARGMGISSSLHMPDKVLNFVKDHFLMDSVIRSPPLLLKRNVRYTQIAVHRVQSIHKAYDVLFIGTGETRDVFTQTPHCFSDVRRLFNSFEFFNFNGRFYTFLYASYKKM